MKRLGVSLLISTGFVAICVAGFMISKAMNWDESVFRYFGNALLMPLNLLNSVWPAFGATTYKAGVVINLIVAYSVVIWFYAVPTYLLLWIKSRFFAFKPLH